LDANIYICRIEVRVFIEVITSIGQCIEVTTSIRCVIEVITSIRQGIEVTTSIRYVMEVITSTIFAIEVTVSIKCSYRSYNFDKIDYQS
jgi:hypothetical protein